MAAAKVWREFDQTELDAQYNSRGTVADFSVFTQQYAEQTLAAKRTLKCVENLSYGDGVDEKLDIYPAAQADAPVMVFFHGGDWRALSKEDSGFAAPACMRAIERPRSGPFIARGVLRGSGVQHPQDEWTGGRIHQGALVVSGGRHGGGG